MKIFIEVEVPDWFDVREQTWEVEKAAQEWVDANYYDYRDRMDSQEGDASHEDVIDTKGRL